VQSIFHLESLQLTETEALLVVVMEHCDLGSLQRALQRKAFLPSAKWPQHATFRALLRTAAEIAKGMEYIHGQHGVVHGDLKPANVLLKTHRADRRGYVAKVADFGLSWHVEGNQFNLREDKSTTAANISENTINTNSTTNNFSASVGGTTAYLPPEAFENSATRGLPGDVYAFGVMLWSMYYCKNPYEGMLEAQVCAGVLNGWLRPEFTEDCPAAFRLLAEQCWSQQASERPTFAQVWRELVNIEVDFRSQRLRSKSRGVVGGEYTKRPASAPIKVERTTVTVVAEPSTDKAAL
jgi:serine/threonine protein kinase